LRPSLTRRAVDCSFHFLMNRAPGVPEQTPDGQQQDATDALSVYRQM